MLKDSLATKLATRARQLQERLSSKRIHQSRLSELSEDTLKLVAAISEQGDICSLDDLRRILVAPLELAEALTDSLPAALDVGLLHLKNSDWHPRYQARPRAGVLARAELERRERSWTDPGPKIGPRSRPSAFA